MGFLAVMGPCLLCHQVFSYNPHSVPSFTPPGGTREPICASCIAFVNAKRKERGLPEWPVLPDAYEPLDENNL
jgi:hypothetical protein